MDATYISMIAASVAGSVPFSDELDGLPGAEAAPNAYVADAQVPIGRHKSLSRTFEVEVASAPPAAAPSEPRLRAKSEVLQLARETIARTDYRAAASSRGLTFAAAQPAQVAPVGLGGRLARFVDDYRAPNWDNPEIYVYAASSRDAVAWGPRAMRELRVQSRTPIGDRQIGITMQASALQTSLAYIEREVSNAHRTDRQGFVALALTLRR